MTWHVAVCGNATTPAWWSMWKAERQFLPVGLLPNVAADLHVSLGTAGLMVRPGISLLAGDGAGQPGR